MGAFFLAHDCLLRTHESALSYSSMRKEPYLHMYMHTYVKQARVFRHVSRVNTQRALLKYVHVYMYVCMYMCTYVNAHIREVGM